MFITLTKKYKEGTGNREWCIKPDCIFDLVETKDGRETNVGAVMPDGDLRYFAVCEKIATVRRRIELELATRGMGGRPKDEPKPIAGNIDLYTADDINMVHCEGWADAIHEACARLRAVAIDKQELAELLNNIYAIPYKGRIKQGAVVTPPEHMDLHKAGWRAGVEACKAAVEDQVDYPLGILNVLAALQYGD